MRKTSFILAAGMFFLTPGMTVQAVAQVENVPLSNQVYEFLDRLGVRGILPQYSATIIPASRSSVAALLEIAEGKRNDLSDAERAYLDKFKREFAREIDPANEDAAGLLNGLSGDDLLSDKEKYLYYYADSNATLYLEFIGSLEHRRADGDSFGATDASFETHGFRTRGTLKEKVGYFLHVTNGTLYGDRDFALSDRRLRTNVKFNDLNTPYFDFTEAHLRADLSWFTVEIGREFTKIGTGYSDRLLLSDNAPAPDLVRLDAEYGAVRYLFVHGSILPESRFLGTLEGGPSGTAARQINKYFTLHRLEISALGFLNAAFSEMAVYERSSPELAYLNPLIFLKSAEHSLRDRDNTLLAFDAELFPAPGYKLFGSLLVDDLDFSKIGTGWWGNQFGWQGGVFLAGVAGFNDVDAVAEYTRLEPYLYTNRVPGNAYTNGDFGMGHHLEPNSDEWFVLFSFRPSSVFRASAGFRRVRHGENIISDGDLSQNVGGDILVGHDTYDSETVHFLDGRLVTTNSVLVEAVCEPVNNLMITGSYEYRHRSGTGLAGSGNDHFGAIRTSLEF